MYDTPIRFLTILKWVFRGKTIARSFMNEWLGRHGNQLIRGVAYDLGGAGHPSFMDVVTLPDTYFTVDMLDEANPSIVANIEETLPIPDNTADIVLLFNTLEHVYGFKHVVSEMWRITKPGGKALIFVPFLVGFHTFQGEKFFINDYFRYTQSSLDLIFTEAGYKNVHVIPRGGLGWAIAELVMVAVRFRIFRILAALVWGGLEVATGRMRAFDSAVKYPLGYFVVAERPI